MALHTLQKTILAVFSLFVCSLIYWVLETANGANPLPIILFQIWPLIFICPAFITWKPPHLHVALPVIMIYLCFTAPNLFRDGQAQLIAFAELFLNIIVSSLIMWFLLKVSKQRRQDMLEQQTETV
mgnify:CR=1 FL=1